MNGGNGRDTLNGGNGRDTLNGGNGNDRLFGNEKADLLNGGAGSDRMDGGAGVDTFAFKIALGAPARDVILNFEVGLDVLDFGGFDVSVKFPSGGRPPWRARPLRGRRGVPPGRDAGPDQRHRLRLGAGRKDGFARSGAGLGRASFQGPARRSRGEQIDPDRRCRGSLLSRVPDQGRARLGVTRREADPCRWQ
jgi:hypothetical protein